MIYYYKIISVKRFIWLAQNPEQSSSPQLLQRYSKENPTNLHGNTKTLRATPGTQSRVSIIPAVTSDDTAERHRTTAPWEWQKSKHTAQ